MPKTQAKTQAVNHPRTMSQNAMLLCITAICDIQQEDFTLSHVRPLTHDEAVSGFRALGFSSIETMIQEDGAVVVELQTRNESSYSAARHFFKSLGTFGVTGTRTSTKKVRGTIKTLVIDPRGEEEAADETEEEIE